MSKMSIPPSVSGFVVVKIHALWFICVGFVWAGIGEEHGCMQPRHSVFVRVVSLERFPFYVFNACSFWKELLLFKRCLLLLLLVLKCEEM